MRTMTLHSSIPISLVVGCLAASTWGQAPAGPSERIPDGPVNCVVKITCDPFLLPLNPQSLRALLESSLVTGEAFKQAMQRQDVNQTYYVEFKPLPGGTTAAPAGVMPVTPMMGMMGGPPPQPPQASGDAVPRMGYSGYGYGGRRSSQTPQAGEGVVPGAQGGKGGDEGGGRSFGPRAAAPDDSAASSRRGASDGLRSAFPAPQSAGPMSPGASSVRPFQPGMPGAGGPPGTFDVTVPAVQESSILGQIEVQIDGGEPRENEAFLRAVCERLQQSLSDLHSQEMASVERQMLLSQDELARAQMNLRELQKRRRDLLGAEQVELMPEAVMDQARRLSLERQQLEMDLLGQQARLKALQRQVQETSERILRESSDDAIAKPLREKLELLRDQLNRAVEQGRAGLVPESEVQKARIAVSEGEAALAALRQRVSQAGGGEVLGRLNSELAMLSATAAETEARLKYLHEQAEKNKQILEMADDYEMTVSMAMPYARRAYETSKLRVEDLEQRIRTAVAPMVTVIGGATSKPAK